MSIATPYALDVGPPPEFSESDPYFYGWRTVEREQADGTTKSELIPLTEWDVLHPLEGDFIVLTDGHSRDCTYLQQCFEDIFQGRAHIKVFREHRIDWEVPKIIPHGPDITIVDGLTEEWDPTIGTFMMRQMNCEPLLVVEVTSPSTRKGDLHEKVKEYHKAGVPFYVIVDRHVSRSHPKMEVIGYRTTAQGYAPIEQDPEKGLWIPTVGVWFKIEADRISCRRANGERIADRAEILQELRTEQELRVQATRRAEKEGRKAKRETQRAEQESQRAEEEKQQAEKERQRANDLERKVRELEEKLNRLTAGG